MFSGPYKLAEPLPPSVPPTASAMEGVNVDVNDAAKQIADLRDRARSIADGYFGVAPSLANNATSSFGGATANPFIGGTVGASPLGRSEMTRNALRDLHAVIADLRTQIDRLSCI